MGGVVVEVAGHPLGKADATVGGRLAELGDGVGAMNGISADEEDRVLILQAQGDPDESREHGEDHQSTGHGIGAEAQPPPIRILAWVPRFHYPCIRRVGPRGRLR